MAAALLGAASLSQVSREPAPQPAMAAVENPWHVGNGWDTDGNGDDTGTSMSMSREWPAEPQA